MNQKKTNVLVHHIIITRVILICILVKENLSISDFEAKYRINLLLFCNNEDIKM